MRCSDCSEVVRPLVAVDIDGTLGDYHGHFINFAQSYLGRTQEFGSDIYLGVEPFRVWFCRVFRVDETTFRTVKLAYRQGGMKRSMPIYGAAADMMADLKKWGCEVWITTTRPYLRLDGIDPDTREWLFRHGIVYEGLLYDEEKYERLAERVDPNRVVAVLDDLPEQYDAAARLFGDEIPILRGNQYNMGSPRNNFAGDLYEAAAMIRERVLDWEARNA